jgi:ribosomal protein S17
MSLNETNEVKTGRVVSGTVVSSKMDKSIVVLVERRYTANLLLALQSCTLMMKTMSAAKATR